MVLKILKKLSKKHTRFYVQKLFRKTDNNVIQVLSEDFVCQELNYKFQKYCFLQNLGAFTFTVFLFITNNFFILNSFHIIEAIKKLLRKKFYGKSFYKKTNKKK